MKKSIEARIRIVLISLVLVISILALILINRSTAWLSNNENVAGSGMSLTVKNDMGITASLVSHPVTGIDYTAGTYVADLEKESFALPTEDPNGISYSEYKKALIVEIIVDSQVQSTISMKLVTPSGVDTIDDVENKLSNCVAISTATLSVVNGQQVFTKNKSTEASFVTVSEQGVTKKTEINLVLENPQLKEGENRFFFIVEYKYSETKKYDLISYISERVMAVPENIPLLEAKENTITYHDDIEFQIYK